MYPKILQSNLKFKKRRKKEENEYNKMFEKNKNNSEHEYKADGIGDEIHSISIHLKLLMF